MNEVRALPGSYPVKVRYGDVVRLSRVKFLWKGPPGTIYVCWGLKAGFGGFDNGKNLAGGVFSSAQVLVPDSRDRWSPIEQAVIADLYMTMNMKPGKYDVYDWLALSPSTLESEMVSLSSFLWTFARRADEDAGIVEIVSPGFLEAKDLAVEYQPV